MRSCNAFSKHFLRFDLNSVYFDFEFPGREILLCLETIDLTSLTDTALWEAFCHHDREAFAEIFKRYYPLLYKYGIKVTTNTELLEDCIQELFVELWQQAKPSPVMSVKAYLIKALKYKLIKAIRKNELNVPTNGSDVPFELSYESLLVTKQDREARLKELSEALQKLTARQREIIYLKYFHGLSYHEVSEIMSINYQGARNLLYQAVKSLRKFLVSGLLFLV